MLLTDPLFRTQARRLAQALAAALEDPQLETEVDTTCFTGAHRETAAQANRILERLREQTTATHNLWDTWNKARATMDQLTRALDDHKIQCADLATRGRELARLQSVLNKVSTRVMIADETGAIVYVNPALAATLREIGDELAPALHGIEADSVLGCNIDLFHADPFRRRGKGLAYEPVQQTTLYVAQREFQLVISDLHDDTGVHIGTIVEWQDRPASADRFEACDRSAMAAAQMN
ncbi:MAG: hypothetical protein KAY46_02500 [Burkholderiaceae bacterium]|nr:hypothetical protein [Burkholderiaceae bacterium]